MVCLLVVNTLFTKFTCISYYCGKLANIYFFTLIAAKQKQEWAGKWKNFNCVYGKFSWLTFC